MSVLNLNTVIVNMLKMLTRVIGEDIELVKILDPEVGNVMADIGQMEQILANLTINARDAMPQGGKITFETKNVDLDEEFAHKQAGIIPGPYVMLVVGDTGTGMDKIIQARIFEPFFTTKEKGKGTGLGLAIIYGILRQNKGSIQVQSEVGMGTTFKIYLPRVAEAVAAPGVKNSAVDKSGRGLETILLVEDEAKVRKVAKRILESNGYHILEASDGLQALELSMSYQEDIHLVLTDVVMPGMGGKEMAERLLASRPEIKVLFMSGYMSDPARNAIAPHEGLKKASDFLHKPFTIASLTTKVRKALDAD